MVEEACRRSVLREIFVIFTLRRRSILIVAILLGKPIIGGLLSRSIAWGM